MNAIIYLHPAVLHSQPSKLEGLVSALKRTPVVCGNKIVLLKTPFANNQQAVKKA